MTIKTRLLDMLPSVRWTPHDIASPESSSQAKPRSRFSLRSSSLVSSSALAHHRPVKKRKSRISLTSMPDPELDARTLHQEQSLFFARLPLEIRRMVYEYVVGSETVHLTLGAKQKFGHFVCEDDDEESEGRECACRVLVGGKQSAKLDRACVGLIRACRRMYVLSSLLQARTSRGDSTVTGPDKPNRYSEAVPYLYNPHTFSLLHATHLLYLPSRTPQQRLDSIRTLRLRWAIRALPHLRRGPAHRLAYHEDTANWEKGWAILASLQSLRSLCVVVTDPSPQRMWEGNWLELEALLLEPVKRVVRPGRFELVLPYAGCDVERDMGESRVRLRRPEGGSGFDEDA
jgi:hypothetical protein